ncbi:hypothetical protein TCAL_16258 [Tigriopus californicus]|uniref:SSD domain-containing protein n=1 Tax=Tigriopus californicus TaxID=6832 RepID=A0A553N901_TIGCA|nr:hypothetical protein TCAL_16258 [Tigriopus californicus]
MWYISFTLVWAPTPVNNSFFFFLAGLTIDTVSCTILIISIGLCVDFSAHIAHAFLHAQGTRNQRIQESLTNIGPAVLNGGFSTFLSFILLFNSNSHVFDTFFKVFFLVVVFGLFNGLAFLPTLLSLIGPSSVTGSSASLDDPQQDQPSSALSKPSEPASICLEPSIKTCPMPKSAKDGEGLPLEELLQPLNPPPNSTSSSSV